jgi:hypothetical protein
MYISSSRHGSRIESVLRLTRRDPLLEQKSFVDNIHRSREFETNGVVYGRNACWWWVVVDPRVYPLHVWTREPGGMRAYARAAEALGAPVFTNGPMMGKRLGANGKLSKLRAARELTAWTVAGAIGGFVIAAGRRGRYVFTYGGAVAGAATASLRVFTDWSACGDVRSRSGKFDDLRNFDGEGASHSWFGRFADGFASHRIGDGDLPPRAIEGVGGLIRLVQDFEPVSSVVGHRRFNADFAALSRKTGIVAWALVPIDRRPRTSRSRISPPAHDADGVIVVIGGRRKLDAFAAAHLLSGIGARDAVAVDQRTSAMMGARNEFMIGPPPSHRQAMQLYGLCCRRPP